MVKSAEPDKSTAFSQSSSTISLLLKNISVLFKIKDRNISILIKDIIIKGVFINNKTIRLILVSGGISAKGGILTNDNNTSDNSSKLSLLLKLGVLIKLELVDNIIELDHIKYGYKAVSLFNS